MAGAPFGFGPPSTGPYSGLRRSVIDPETRQPVVTSPPTGAVMQRASVLPIGRDDSGRLVPAMPGLAMQAVEAAKFPGQVYRGEASVFDPETGHASDEAVGKAFDLAGTAMTGGLGGVAKQAGETALGAAPIRAFHGSPHSFDRFDITKLGTGEGAQQFGHGLYFAENEAVAKSYRDNLSPMRFRENGRPISDPDGLILAEAKARHGTDLDEVIANLSRGLEGQPANLDDPVTQQMRQYLARAKELQAARVEAVPTGHMYEVAINADPARMLDLDAPLMRQGEGVRRFAERAGLPDTASPTGSDFVSALTKRGYDPAELSADLRKAGVPGIRYLDEGSRATGDGTRNVVTFSDDIVSILRKYGLAGAAGAGGAAAALAPPSDAQAAPSQGTPPVSASPLGLGAMRPEDIARLFGRQPGPVAGLGFDSAPMPSSVAPGDLAPGRMPGSVPVAMDEAETQRLERATGMMPSAPAQPTAGLARVPLPPTRPPEFSAPSQADLPAEGAQPMMGQAAPQAGLASAPAREEPGLMDRIMGGIQKSDGLLTSLGIGLMTQRGIGQGIAAGLQHHQTAQQTRAVTDMTKARLGLDLAKARQDQTKISGNAKYAFDYMAREGRPISEEQALALGSNTEFMNKLFSRSLPAEELYTKYVDQAGNTWSRNQRTGQETIALQAKDDKSVAMVPEEERARLGLPAGSYQRDANGKVSPVNPTGTTINMGAEKAQDAKVGGGYGEYQLDLATKGRNASSTLNTLALMEQAMKQPGFYSGTGGEAVKRANQMLGALGLKDSKAASGAEVFDALSNKVVLDGLGGSLGPGISNTDRDYISRTAPTLERSDEGNKALIGIARSLAQRQQAVAKLARDYAAKNGGRVDGGFDQVLEDFASANPLFPQAKAGAAAGAPQDRRSIGGKSYIRGADGGWYED